MSLHAGAAPRGGCLQSRWATGHLSGAATDLGPRWGAGLTAEEMSHLQSKPECPPAIPTARSEPVTAWAQIRCVVLPPWAVHSSVLFQRAQKSVGFVSWHVQGRAPQELYWHSPRSVQPVFSRPLVAGLTVNKSYRTGGSGQGLGDRSIPPLQLLLVAPPITRGTHCACTLPS